MLRWQFKGGNDEVAMFRTRFSVDQLSPPHPAKNSSFIIFARTSIKGTVSTSTSVVEPKIFIFGSGSILVPYFGSGYSYSSSSSSGSSSSHILPLKTVLHITVILYQWRNKLVFLHPSILQTGCSKYLYIKKDNFGSGSRSQITSASPAPQHWCGVNCQQVSCLFLKN